MKKGDSSVANARFGATESALQRRGIARTAAFALIFVLLAPLLSACGQRGPLTLPAMPPPAVAPASSPAPAT